MIHSAMIHSTIYSYDTSLALKPFNGVGKGDEDRYIDSLAYFSFC